MAEEQPIPTARDGIPPEMIQELHEANQQFSHAKQHVDQATASTASDGLKAREQAIQEVVQAEKTAEKADEKIKGELHKP